MAGTSRKKPQKLRPLSWLLGRPLGHVLVVLWAVLLLGGAVYAVKLSLPWVRDLAVAHVSHWLAGRPIPYPDGEPAYFSDQLVLVWDTKTNAPFFAEKAYEIVPFFAVEGLTGAGAYPGGLLVVPYPDATSLVIAGNALPGVVVMMNLRYTEDQGDALITLTHELIHTQGGYFLDPPEGITGMERSYYIESRTSSATIEVLAGMCRWGDPVACRGFWLSMEDMARRSVQAKLLRAGVPWLYELWAGTLRNDVEDLRGEKMDRLWSDRREEQQQIVERYGELPWTEQVLPGLCGEPMATGLSRYIGDIDGRQAFQVLSLDFDDAREMLGWLGTALVCAGR